MSLESALGNLIEVATTPLADRIYPLQIPSSAGLPNAVYQRISTRREPTLAGPNGLALARVQIDIFAATKAEVDSLATTVRGLLDGYRGTTSGVKIQETRLENEQDQFETNTEVWRVILDFIIRFEE